MSQPAYQVSSAWQTVYVSNGVGKFADRELQTSDQAMKTWLTENKDWLTMDDVFQAWVAAVASSTIFSASSYVRNSTA